MIVLWILVILVVAFVVLWFVGAVMSESDRGKANAYLAGKYDRENGP